MKSAVAVVLGVAVFLPQAVTASHGRSLDEHALAEFMEYAARLVAIEPKIAPHGVCTVAGTNAGFAVGRCGLSDALVAKGRLSIPKDLGDEGFLVKSVEDGGRNYLVILGGSPKGTLYGVYHYLEKCCRVGFFWDGEHVPRLGSLPAAGIDVVERPRWPMRQYMMDGEYTSYWWNWDQWKAEVDWAAQHRFNVLSSNFDFTATWRAVWKRFGVEVPPSSLSGPPFHPWAGWHKWAIRPPYPVAYQDFQADLAKRFTDYGRSVGIKMAPDFRGFLGQVPREFAKAYRGKARFLEVGWGGFDPPGVICPLYMLHITGDRLGGERPYGAEQARQFLPHLQAALEVALAEADRAGARALYDRDLIDIARQFLSGLFNVHAARLVRAFRSNDPKGFRRESAALKAILESQEVLLSSSEEFCLSPVLARARALPHAPEDIDERIRDILTVWAGKILDYAHRDYYELLRFYYRKRVEAFLAQAESNLAARRPIVDDRRLEPVDHEIEQRFVKTPFVVTKGDRCPGTPVQAARELLARHRLSDAELNELAAETFGPTEKKTSSYSIGEGK